MGIIDINNPGLSGLDELTTAEELVVQQIAGLGDPNADRILFWDDSAGSFAYLSVGSGLSITNTTITATGATIDGSGTTNEIAYWVDSDTLGALAVATYPSLTELSYVKGVTSAIQTQLNAKAASLGADDNYVTDAQLVVIANTSGTNTGDNATNTQYSGLAASKADVGQTFYIGTTQVAINRASAALTLAGLTLTTPDIGTPSAGVVTNLSGTASININGTVGATTPTTGVFTTLVAGSTTSLLLGTAGSAVGNIGFRNATSGTITLAPVTGALGTVTLTLPAATDTVAVLAATQTFTNKRITQRVVTTTDDATAVIDVDVTDTYQLSAVANNTEFTVTGTPTDGQKLIVRYKDAGVSKTLTWTFATAIGVTLPAATTAGKWGYVGCIYNSAASQWHAVAVATQA